MGVQLHSSCLESPEILSEVEVYSCQPLTIGASVLPLQLPGLQGDYNFNDHLKIDPISGVIIRAKVLKSNLVWPDTKHHIEPAWVQWKPWPAGNILFFISGTPEDVCPGTPTSRQNRSFARKNYKSSLILNTEKVQNITHVVTLSDCCDTFPAQGTCLVPFPIVKEEFEPEKWVLQTSSNSSQQTGAVDAATNGPRH